MTRSMNVCTRLAALACVAWASGSAIGQAPTPPAPPPKDAPTTPAPNAPALAPSAAQPGSGQPTPAPTLDELLGLEPQGAAPKPGAGQPSGATRPAPVDPTRAELDRRLSAAEAAEKFEEAVAMMGDAAQRLRDARDAGVQTQRLHQDILARLDMVIREAEQNRQRQRQQSRSRSQQQQQGEPRQQQGQAQQRPSDQRAGPNQEEMQPPAGERPDLRPDVAARGQAWGNLPQRVREALLQGQSDRYSSLYQQWTEIYYRKLAEEQPR